MLICVGKIGETIVLDDKTKLTLLSVKDNKILLRFESLEKVCIYRRQNVEETNYEKILHI